MADPSRALKILSLLKKSYPKATTALNHRNPLELLVATILSAQCTDVRVNKVTPAIFKKYRKASDYAGAELPALEQEIRTTGFYRQKAKSIKNVGAKLVSDFGGRVPKTLEELVTLPGVWRKTANVVLGTWFGIPGVVVDTHVRRVSYRLGLTKNTDPDKIEIDLMKAVPKKEWVFFSHALIWHGRKICAAIKPDCAGCPLNPECPKLGVTAAAAGPRGSSGPAHPPPGAGPSPARRRRSSP